MRAKIIQYNSSEGKGIALAEGQQYDFSIRQWRSDTAPGVGQTVDITFIEGRVEAIFVVGSDVLMKEKLGDLSNLAGKFNVGSGNGSADLVLGGYRRLGAPILVSYLCFLFATVMFNAFSVKMFGTSQGVTLWDISDLLKQLNVGGGMKFLLVMGYLSILVPLFWSDRRAWLAMCIPAIPLLKAGYDAYSMVSEFKKQMGGVGSLGKNFADSISSAYSIGFGFYMAIAAALALAGLGFIKSRGGFVPSTFSAHSVSTGHSTPSVLSQVQQKCPKCLVPIQIGDTFCGDCGQKLI
jgi:hypothetical protein